MHWPVSLTAHTLLIDDGHAADVLLDQHVDDVHDRRVHVACRNVLVGADVHLAQGLAQLLRLLDVDGNKLQDAVLCDDRHDHGAFGFVVDIDHGDAARAGLEHLATCLVDGPVRVDGYCFDGLDAEGLFDFCACVSVSVDMSSRGLK